MRKKYLIKDFKNEENILNKDIKCNVLIIGAGITSLSCVYHLINSNLNGCRY